MLPLDSMIGPTEKKSTNVYKILTTVLRKSKSFGIIQMQSSCMTILYIPAISVLRFSALVHCIFSYCFAIVNEIITIKTRPNGQRNPS